MKSRALSPSSGKASVSQAQAPLSEAPALPSTERSRVAYFIAATYGIIMLILALSRKIGLYDVETDFYGSFVLLAKQLLNGEIPVSPYHGPVYPAILALVNLFLRDYDFFLTGRIVSVLSAVLSLYFLFILTKNIFNRNIAILTTLSLAFNPTFFRYSYIASSDMFFVFMCVVSIAISIKILPERRPYYHIIPGLMAAILYLTRYNGVFMAFSYAFMLLIYYYRSYLNLLIRLLFFLFGFSLIIVPWGFHTKQKTGVFLYNENYYNIAWEVYGKDRMSWDEFWQGNRKADFHSLIDVIIKDPLLFVEKIGGNIIINIWYHLTDLLGWLFMPLFIIGIWQLVRLRSAKVLYFSILYLFSYLILALVFYVDRFFLSLLIFYVPFCWSSILWKPLSRWWLIAVLFSITNIVGLIKAAKKYKEDINSEPLDVLNIAQMFRRQYGSKEEGKAIMARKPHIANYLGMNHQGIPVSVDVSGLEREMRQQKVDYLYFSGIEYALRPALRDLANYQTPPPYLEVVMVNARPFAVLYRLRQSSPSTSASAPTNSTQQNGRGTKR